MTTTLDVTDAELAALGKMFAFTFMAVYRTDPDVAAVILQDCRDVVPDLKTLARKGLAAHRANQAQRRVEQAAPEEIDLGSAR